MIDVSKLATGGNGSSANPWTGWDTAVAWAASQTYYFPSGTYSFAKTITAWGKSGIRIMGDGMSTILQFTGTGIALAPTPGPGDLHGDAVWGITIEHLKIVGNPACTTLLSLPNTTAHVHLVDLYARECTNAAYVLNSILGQTDFVRFSVNEELNTTIPATGFLLSALAWTFNNLIAEGAGTGISLVNAAWNVFNGGTSEGNTAFGMALDSMSNLNTIIGVDFEVNPVDVQCLGYFNTFININSIDTFSFPSGGNANSNRVNGGYFNQVTIGAGATGNSFTDIVYNSGGTGGFTDDGNGTIPTNVRNAANSGVAQPTSIVQRMRISQQTGGPAPFTPTISLATGLDTGVATAVAGSSDSLMIITLAPAGNPNSKGLVNVAYSAAFANAIPFPTLLNATGTWDPDATVQAGMGSASNFVVYWSNGGKKLQAGDKYQFAVLAVSM